MRERLSEQEVRDCLALNPFDGDFGCHGDVVFSDRICTARKPGTCNDCAGPILPSEQQRRHDAKYDYEMRSYRWCFRCCRAMAAYWTDDGKALNERWVLRAQRRNEREPA